MGTWREKTRGEKERMSKNKRERGREGGGEERERVVSQLGYSISSYYAVHVSAKIKQIGI